MCVCACVLKLNLNFPFFSAAADTQTQLSTVSQDCDALSTSLFPYTLLRMFTSTMLYLYFSYTVHSYYWITTENIGATQAVILLLYYKYEVFSNKICVFSTTTLSTQSTSFISPVFAQFTVWLNLNWIMGYICNTEFQNAQWFGRLSCLQYFTK